jgi:C1A family cysteine protease
MGINSFTDLTSDEFLASINEGLLIPNNIKRYKKTISDMKLALPTAVDWRTQNIIGRIKNQGQCGSCWSFSANEVVESYTAMKTGILPDLSEQNLVDCVYNRDGCHGGYMSDVYNYIQTNGGLNTESSYSYVSGSTSKVN